MKLIASIFLTTTLAVGAQTTQTGGRTFPIGVPVQGQVQVQQTDTIVDQNGSTMTSSTSSSDNSSANPPANTFPPGLQDRTVPPGLNRPLPPGLANRNNGLTMNSNFAGNAYLSNQFIADSNAVFSGNAVYNSNSYNVISNASNLLPTANSNVLSRIYGTNAFNSNFRLSDQAFSDMDKSLLLTLRQSVSTQLGVTPTGYMPVHFYIRNGIVTLVGSVISAEESQRVALVVQQTPGVVSVVNDLQVSGGSGGIVQPLSGTLQNGTAPAQPVVGTNLPPTGYSNGVNPNTGLPPGLERRDQLPPGLRNRETLPPGLERRTNNVP